MSSRIDRPQTIRPTGSLVGGLAGQRQCAAVEVVDHRGVAQQQRVGGEEGLVVGRAAAAAAARRSAPSGRGRRRCRAPSASTCGDPAAPRLQQVDVVGRADAAAAADARAHARVVVGLACGQACAVPGPALGRADLAAASAAGASSAGSAHFDDLGAGAAQPCQARSKARATVASRPSSMPPRGSARRSARSGRPRRRTRRAASTSCSSTASRTVRVMAQAVSSVEDSGSAAFGGCQRLGVLEAHQAVQRGRDADRAARVRAERRPGRAGRHRDRAARGRAARDARRGVERRRGRRWPACRGAD